MGLRVGVHVSICVCMCASTCALITCKNQMDISCRCVCVVFMCVQGIAGLDCWIAQSGLQSDLVDWIVIDNPKSKLDFGFGLSIQFFHFNPNPKRSNYFSLK